MRHPFIKNPILLIWYVLFWIVISVFQLFLEMKIFGISLSLTIVDVIVSNLLFMVIGIALWYVIGAANLAKYNNLNLAVYHIFVMLLFVSFWLWSSTQIVFALFEKEMLADYSGGIFLLKAGLGGLFYVLVSIFFYMFYYYDRLKEKSVEESRLKELVVETQLNALKSQINPHFLFNSLNSVSYLTMSEPEKAQDMVIKLSTFLRYSLKHNENQMVSLVQEIDHIKLYLDIEKVRFGDKLDAIFEVSGCLDCKLPNMLLQPIYENAIKYGVYETTSRVVIHTRASLEGGFLLFSVSNNYDPDTVAKKGEGIGLLNIRKRLGLVYGNATLMQIKNENNIFTVTLKFPQ